MEQEAIPRSAAWRPRLIGVDQVNTQIVDSDREGCAVPLTVGTSQPVTVSIHRGGGVCVDPPPAAEGIVLLQRTTIVGTANDGTVETLDATFVQSPGRKATPIQLPLQNYNYETDLLSPSCPVPGYLYLSAGSLSLKTPSSTLSGLTAAPGSSYAVTLPPNPLRPGNYHVTLPSGTLQPANFTLAPDTPGTVGPFQINLAFGKDIQILTPPPAVGSTLSSGDKITVSWSGGDPDSLVSVSLISHYPQRHFRSTCQALASVGQCTLAYVVYNGVTSIANPRTSHGELIYQIDPPPPSITTFSAPGLSLGGQAIWRIVHSFQGFAIE